MSSEGRSRVALAAAVAGAATVAAVVLYIRAQKRAAEAALGGANIEDAGVTSAPHDAGTGIMPPSDSTQRAPASITEPSAPPAVNTARAEEARRAKERGNKRFSGKQFALAIKDYTEAISLAEDKNDPEVAKYYGNRAQCHACLEQHAEAAQDCDAALAIDPKYVKALVRR
jgi:tetratricopeptide (TPR) repeat protein